MKDSQTLCGGSAPPTLAIHATTNPNDRQQVAPWLEAEHFLGAFQPVGHTLFQIVTEADQVLAVVVWAASAYHLKDRDAWIGRANGRRRRPLRPQGLATLQPGPSLSPRA